ncbi:MAG: L-lactate dehydrogenase [Clostridiales bacterium]|nr:L-lactate dehydrogenase [Clostridiales bacterium]
MANKGKKIVILGAGNVGASIAYTLTVQGVASEIVLIDINFNKAKGEAMDIIQGTAFCPPVNIYAGQYENAKDADIVIVTVGAARKPGQSRIDLAQGNVNIVKQVMPQIIPYAPGAVYVVVSNPVDIITYAIIKTTELSASQVIGSGTTLDSARLRSRLAEHVGLNPKNVHAYVLGEHGDSSVIPWSLATIGGIPMNTYCLEVCNEHNRCGKAELREIEEDVRTAGAKVIANKGATYYAIALAVSRICSCIIRDTGSVLTVSSLLNGQYGLSDVCLSIPYVVGAYGISHSIASPLTAPEQKQLEQSAAALRSVLDSLEF